MKKWSNSLSVINENTDKLSSAEQDAIKTLCNLWRREKYGQSCSESVERMVKILLSNENAHGGNQLPLKEALKDFRSISKELYTKDEETFKQFATAAKDLLGGPQLTEEQQQQRQQAEQRRRQEADQREAQQRQREAQQRQQEAERQRQREAERQRQQQSNRNNQNSNRGNQQSNRRNQQSNHSNQQSNRGNQRGGQGNGGREKLFLWVGISVAVVTAIAGIALFFLSGTSVEESKQARMDRWLKGTWTGEFQGRQAQLSIDSVTTDSVFGRMNVKFRRSTEVHELAGTATITNSILHLLLDDMTAKAGGKDNLNGSYKLLLDTVKKSSLVGTYNNYETQETTDLKLAKGSDLPAEKQPAKAERPAKKKSEKAQQKPRNTTPETEDPVYSEPAKVNQEPQVEQNTGTGFKLERVEPDKIPEKKPDNAPVEIRF